jgi:hypothetical protein
MVRASREASNIMRPSQWLVGVSGVGAIVGAIATGCGDDTAATGTTDAGGDTSASSGASSGTASSGSSGSSGSSSSGKADAGAPDCGTLIPTNVGTFDSGSALWSCIQGKCPSLATCGTMACCNNSILAALQCVADGGTGATCFTTALGVADMTTSACIVMNAMCGASDAGDAGHEGGEGGTPADASDGGTSDASGG